METIFSPRANEPAEVINPDIRLLTGTEPRVGSPGGGHWFFSGAGRGGVGRGWQ